MTSEEFNIDDLMGAEVVGVENGVYVSFDKIWLKLENGKVVTVSPLYDEGLFINEVEGV